MNKQVERPPFIDCGHCRASMRVLWRFDGGWTASECLSQSGSISGADRHSLLDK